MEALAAPSCDTAEFLPHHSSGRLFGLPLAPPQPKFSPRGMSLQPGFDHPACSFSGMCGGSAASGERGSTASSPISQLRGQCLLINFRCFSLRKNSQVGRRIPVPAGEDQAVGREEVVMAQGVLQGGGRAGGWCVTVPVGLAWLCWDTSHFCHFWPEGSPC